MPPESRLVELGRELSSLGLDLNRYTTTLAEHFLTRWPNAADWRGSEAQSYLIATFAIGETTFLRHPEHFQTLSRLLPGLAEERKGAPLRVWSAGCASGEEVYSLAAIAERVLSGGVDVVGWDLNPDAIARAMLGEYRPWSLRGVEAVDTEGWLSPSPCGVRVTESLRQRVTLRVGNLHADPFPSDLDVVFCRNVLLYFRPEAAASVIRRIAQALRPGGVLFLGHYDPRPTPDAGLALEVLDGIQFYRRPGAPSLPIKASRSIPPRPLSSRVTSMPPVAEPPPSLETIRTLVNQRRSSEALSSLAALRTSSPLDPSLHILTALAAEDAGDMRLMLEAARRACFLLPDAPAPNYFLSVAFIRNGELRRAAVHRRIAAAALRNEQEPSALLRFSEGLTVGQLRRLIGAIAR